MQTYSIQIIAKPYTLLTILCRHIPHQQNIFNKKNLHTYNLPLLAVDLVKEYQRLLRFKDIYLYIMQNQ